MVLAAVGQICSTSAVGRNLELCLSVIKRASAAGARLIYLPEASDFIADASQVKSLTAPLATSQFVLGLRAGIRTHNSGLADDRTCWVGVGVHETAEGDDQSRCFNTQLLIDERGDIVQAYRKVHLFDVDIAGGATILESRTTKPGSEVGEPVPSPAGKLGLMTCYDIRFPEHSLALRRKGAEVLTYPSAFTMKTGLAHWSLLLRARAVETQSFVLAPAQVGKHSATRESYGHSLIVDPWGVVLAELGPETHDAQGVEGTFVTAELDLEVLKRIRIEMPLWDQRRPDVYSIP